MSSRRRVLLAALTLLMLAPAAPRRADAQILETETARFLRRGHFELGGAFEVQTSKEGFERAIPFAAEYGLTDRISLLVEPVAYTAIRPKRGPRATGAGDLEISVLGLVKQEAGGWPALAFALEGKVPTTKNVRIGTGQTDMTGYAIASRRFGRLDTHANLSYTILGQPAGVTLNNVWGGAVGAELELGTRWVAFGEMLGATAATPEGGDTPGTTTAAIAPEVGGSEWFTTVGLGVKPRSNLMLSLGVTYDSNNAVMFRPGVTLWLR
jgi:hypothetical protein